jgi:hypothetical protein
MFNSELTSSEQRAFREKARLNAWISRDLAEGFGGRKVDYLKRLNGRLKEEIHLCCRPASSGFAEAA